MHGIFRSRKRRVKSFEFLNPRSSIRGTFIPLQSRAFFSFFFFLINCTEHATLEEPLEGVDFALPLFFLSFFFTSTSDRTIKDGILTAKFPINLVSRVSQLFLRLMLRYVKITRNDV